MFRTNWSVRRAFLMFNLMVGRPLSSSDDFHMSLPAQYGSNSGQILIKLLQWRSQAYRSHKKIRDQVRLKIRRLNKNLILF